MDIQIFLVWTFFFLLVISIYEGFLRARKIESSGVYWGGNANSLHKALPQSLGELIENSGSSGVSIMGGTLGNFALNIANKEALGRLHRDGAPVRLLLMDPDASGVEHLAEQRRQVGSSISTNELRSEIRKSLKHLQDQLGRTGMYQCCRLFSHTPRNAVYKLGDTYIVTVYRFGGGGSSPTFSIQCNPENAEFCKGLDRSFDDVWNAESTRPFSDMDIA